MLFRSNVVGKFEVRAVNIESDGVFGLLVLIVSVVILTGIFRGIACDKHRACKHGDEYDTTYHQRFFHNHLACAHGRTFRSMNKFCESIIT